MNWIHQAQEELKAKEYEHAIVTRNGVSYSSQKISSLEHLLLEKDAAYKERNLMLAVLCRAAIALNCHCGIGQHEGEDWEEEWRNIVFIDLPSGQVSWHIHVSELYRFRFLPQYQGKWDGHSNEEKWERALSEDFGLGNEVSR